MADRLNDRQRRVRLGTAVSAWLFIVAPMAGAQEVDSRWTPWVGCWQAVDETASAPLLCVVPLAGEPAIEMLTVVDGQVLTRELIFADGQEHEVSREGCEGWERAEFSDDSHRVYIHSELSCGAGGAGGARGVRNSTGVLSMVTPFEWLDVRTVDVDGQSVPWVLKYRLASREDFRAAGQADLIGAQGTDSRLARVAASVPITLDDVVEASGKVSAETVQVWVVERGEPFNLDASRLIRMADAGVPPNVIDVVVAVSYPQKFVVNDDGGRLAEAGLGRRSLGYRRGLNPFVDPFYDPYSRYGYYSPYGSFGYGLGYYGGYGYGYGGYGFSRIGGLYGGYGLGGYNYGGYYGGYGGPIVVVGRRSGADSGAREGRVVRGGGYTSAGGGGQSTGRSAQPRSSGASARSSGSSGASARSAPARGSSGSSGRSTGRTARPRPPGGN